jgi:predicted DNA-binding protein YlxM (UPF0122 family)
METKQIDNFWDHRCFFYDWEKQDIELAEEHGLSRERIRQLRNKLGMPKPPNYKKHRNAPYQKLLTFSDDVWRTHSNRELADLVGLTSENSVSILRRKYKKPKNLNRKTKPSKYKDIDWTKSAEEIAENLNVTRVAVYMMRRRFIHKYLGIKDLRKIEGEEREKLLMTLNEKLKNI